MWQLIIPALKAFFESITGVSKAVEVRTKPEEIQLSEHAINKPRLLAKERQKILNQSRVYLRLHPKQSITAYVNFKYGSALEPEDCLELISALHELFPRRNSENKKPTSG